MNKFTPLSILFLVTACSDDTPNIFRSSNNIATEDINVYVFAEVHTHIGDSEETSQTHTTIQTEFYGYDSDGYNYSIELSNNEQLSVSVDSETRQVAGQAIPSDIDKRFVEYVTDFGQTGAGTEFQLKLDRRSDASLNTFAISLLGDTSFTATPEADSELTMSENVTIDWLEDDANDYRLRLRLRCFSDTGSNTFLPTNSTRDIATPFTFSIEQLFTLPVEHSFSHCELHSILNTAMFEDLRNSTNFASVIAKVARQQSMLHLINLN